MNKLRLAAFAIVCMAVCILVALFHHPVVQGAANAQEVQAQMARLGRADNLVHGALTVMLVVLASALAVFDNLLAGLRPIPSGARIAYFLGCVLLGVAMLFDGFVLPALATRFAFLKPADVHLLALIIGTIGIVVQEFSKAGLVCLCAAVLLWSYAAAAARPALPGWRWLAALGVPAGLLPAAWILFGDLMLTPHSLMAIFGAHTAWYLAVAASLYRAGRGDALIPNGNARPELKPARAGREGYR